MTYGRVPMDWLRRLVFQRSAARRTCSHLDRVHVVEPVEPSCPACLDEETRWVHVRMCLTCGEPACCDSSTPKHARRHHEQTGHPLIRSVEPGESWGWCYLDDAYLTETQYTTSSEEPPPGA
jgi:uncharacterized UBP type Zn finger protein